nr:hypothetical protein [Tanacetum cinerariifolium]
MKRGFLGEQTPLFPTMLAIQAEEDEAVYEEWDESVERATTTSASLDAAQDSGGSPKCRNHKGFIDQTRPERVHTPPHDSPILRVNTLRSDEGSMSLQELTALCITLSDRVLALETDLRQTKKVYGTAYTKLVMKGRMIEDIDQDTRITLVTPTKVSSQEDQPEDQLGVLSAAKVLADATKKKVNTYTRRRRAVSTGSEGVSNASRIFSTAEESVSIADESMPDSITDVVQEGLKDKGYKMEHFKGKSFYEVKEIFDKVYKQVTSFVSMESDMEKERTKKA